MNDTADHLDHADTAALDPSSISTRKPARMRAASINRPSINPVSVPRPVSPVSRLRPRQAKYSLRLGEIERAEGERIARDMGITLADFIRLAFHNEIQRRRETRETADAGSAVSTSEDDMPEL